MEAVESLGRTLLRLVSISGLQDVISPLKQLVWILRKTCDALLGVLGTRDNWANYLRDKG